MGNSPKLQSSIPIGNLPVVSTIKDPSAPSVFISYSQFSEEHKDWVAKLARKLSNLGIIVFFDANNDGSESLCDFMEHIKDVKYVICVCSESYVRKINEKTKSGVFFEFKRLMDRGLSNPSYEQYIIPILKDSFDV